MDIKFLGAVEGAGEVTGSRTLLTTPDGLKILVDFGMLQSNLGNVAETLKWNGREFEFDVNEIDYLIVTHGHFDHCAGIPLLVKRGFSGKIIATAPTADFCRISFPDNAKIMESDCRWANKRRPKNKLTPLFTIEEAERAIDYIQCYDYNTEIVLSDNVKLELLSSGHMLGACMPKITYTDERDSKSILFTGDTSAKDSSHPFLRVADDIGDVDYIVCEGTYGDRAHNKSNPYDILKDLITNTCIQNRKTLVIPVFSLQRSSEVLWILREIYVKNEQLYKIPIYLDSPMAIKAQSVMDEHRGFWGSKWIERDDELGNLFEWDVIQYINSYQESKYLNNPFPKIILASSGMASGGRVLDHLETFLPSRGCSICFCGYQAEGTLGRKLIQGEQKSVAINRNQTIIRADVESFSMSSHADYNQLTAFIKETTKRGKLKKVIINHGEVEAVESFQKHLRQHLSGVSVIKPNYNEIIKL